MYSIIIYEIFSMMISAILFFTFLTEKKYYFGCPKYIYLNSKLNLFGTITTSVSVLFFLHQFIIFYGSFIGCAMLAERSK